MSAAGRARAVGREVDAERFRPVGIDRGALLKPAWPQMGFRFLFGGTIALAAGLVGMRFGPRVGGVLLAFPAVLPAALTYLQKRDGVEKTDVDAMGAVAGSIAMLAFAVVVVTSGAALGPAGVALAALAWLVIALGLFFAARAILRRVRPRQA